MIRALKLKRRIKKLLVELDLEHDFDTPLLLRKLRDKGYKILLYPMQMSFELNSICILCKNTHVIYIKEFARPFYKQYLIFHELGHILLGHRKLHKEELLRGGTLYSRWEEREAEMFASLLTEAAFSATRRAGIFSEHFQQVLFPPKKSQEETESLQKIAAFFQRFDAHRPV